MLEKLPTLLDVGSGGGDFDKWVHFKFNKVYALDPQLELRKHNRWNKGKQLKDMKKLEKYKF